MKEETWRLYQPGGLVGLSDLQPMIRLWLPVKEDRKLLYGQAICNMHTHGQCQPGAICQNKCQLRAILYKYGLGVNPGGQAVG